MASKDYKYIENTNGSYYVDDSCIACMACTQIAPKHFIMNEDNYYAYVHCQPQNSAETISTQEALDTCPVNAIGDDGNSSK
ncbi:hypothetical protein AB834_01195 [PVC group bacterium (ex Bugula neritina AB1)]|nr:hypothetical protein AB834_01195 [PVC group bacterium (ex Bugula neritina AB1)]